MDGCIPANGLERPLLAGTTSALTALLTEQDARAAIKRALTLVGPVLGVDRIYLAEHTTDASGESLLTFHQEWVRDGEPTVGQPLRVVPEARAWLEQLERHQSFTVTVDQLSDDVRRAMTKHFQSALVVPLIVDGHCWGQLGFVDNHTRRSWNEETKAILHAMAAGIASVLSRERALVELRETSALMAEQAARMRALYESTNPTLPLDAQLQLALTLGCLLLNVDFAFVAQVTSSDAEQCFLIHGSRIDGRPLRDQRLPLSAAAWQNVVAGREGPYLSSSESEQPSVTLPDVSVRSFIEMPLWVGGKPFGILSFGSRQERSPPFNDGDRDFVQVLARWIGLLLERNASDEQRRLVEARVQEAQKLESLGVLAGGVAHDFNNLLMCIMGNASLSAMTLPDSSPVRASLDEITLAAQRAAELTHQLLAYTGKRQLQSGIHGVNSLVSEMTKLLSNVISKSTMIRLELAASLPNVRADGAQLRQVVMNLMTNASDAFEGQAGAITVRTGVEDSGPDGPSGTFVAESAPPGDYVFFEVEDTGCGMDSRTLERIFDPFFTTKFAGRGLGLAAVLGIVRGHRGAIRVHSEPGRGTSFRVLLPAATSSTETPIETPQPTRQAMTGKVLVVDDDDAVRATVERILRWHGVNVLTSSDGDEALEIVRREGIGLDAVVMDVTMPRLDGVKALHDIRQSNGKLPVVLMSGYADLGATTGLEGVSGVSFLQKPFHPAQLVQKLSSVLGIGR